MLVQHYFNHCTLAQSRALKAVGMHEALGGMLAVIIPNSRPEDWDGARANALVVYPVNDDEQKIFDEIKSKRHGSKVKTTLNQINFFTDVPKGIL